MGLSHVGIKLTDEHKRNVRITSSHGFDIELYKDEIISKYSAGNSAKYIASEYGITDSTIRRWLKIWGITLRSSKYPHYYRNSKDGHLISSTAEEIIDNYLFEHNIKHIVNRVILTRDLRKKGINRNKGFRYDFYLPDFKTYIEYWGMTELKEYAKNRRAKEQFYSDNNLNLISIEQTNRLPRLNGHLNRKLYHILKQQKKLEATKC